MSSLDRKTEILKNKAFPTVSFTEPASSKNLTTFVSLFFSKFK